MQQKKASPIITVIIIIFIVVIIGSFITLLVVLKQKGTFDKEKKLTKEDIPLFILPIDEETKDPVKAEYTIEYTEEENRVIFSEGKLSNSWNEVIAPRNKMFLLATWGEEHYLVKGYKEHTPTELTENKSVTSPELPRIGNITLTHSGVIVGVKDIITLNLSTEDWFYKPNLCFAWTSGFTDVTLKNNMIICSEGTWRNQTYNKETKEYEPILNNTYLCGEDYYAKCKYVRGKQCRPEKERKIPNRFLGLVDSCVYLGSSLYNKTIQVELEIASQDYKNQLDEIKIYAFDMDRRWNGEEQMYTWFSELNGENLGNKQDFEYTLKFENGV